MKNWLGDCEMQREVPRRETLSDRGLEGKT